MSKRRIIIIAIILYVISALGSYFIFSNFVNKKTIISTPLPVPSTKEGKLTFDETLPRTEECPINGAMYSKQQRQWWEKHRPLGIMIENHAEARPQSGMSFADVTYEAVAEGGITRTLNIFYCQDAGLVGPVRSARTYFLDFVSEYGSFPLYAHVGGANTSGPADALGQIDDYGWQSYNDLNQFSIGFPTFWRDYERLGHPVATEHTMYSTTEKLWKVGADRGLTNVDKKGEAWDKTFQKYSFKDDVPTSERPDSQNVSFDFWQGYSDYSVKWEYDKASNSYLRFNAGQKHTDKDNDKQLSAKNVVLLFMTESRANDGYEGNLHMLYGTKGTGKATILMDGKKISGTWSKKNRTSRLIINDSAGLPIKFTKGKIWFTVLAIGNDSVVAK